MNNRRPFAPPYPPLAKKVQFRDTSPATIAAVLEDVRKARELRPVLNRIEAESGAVADSSGQPFDVKVIDMAAAGIDTAGQRIGGGHKLIFLKDGSTVGARLDVAFGGSPSTIPLAPGQTVRCRFSDAQVVRNARSAVKGTAKLLVVRDAQADYTEDLSAGDSGLLAAVDLIGTASSSTFVAVAEDTQPSGAAPQGSFNVTGFKTLRVLVDGQAANTLTTADLIPWSRDPDSGLWFEGGGELVSVPDSASSGYRYRSFLMSVRGFGLMFFEIRNLLPAGATQLGFIVQGVE